MFEFLFKGNSNANSSNKHKNSGRNSKGAISKQEKIRSRSQQNRTANNAKRKKGKEKLDDQSTIIFKAMGRDFLEALENCASGKELEILHGILRPDPHLLWYKCMEVKKDLVSALSQYYPSVRLEVFGSTVMGTAFKGIAFVTIYIF